MEKDVYQIVEDCTGYFQNKLYKNLEAIFLNKFLRGLLAKIGVGFKINSLCLYVDLKYMFVVNLVKKGSVVWTLELGTDIEYPCTFSKNHYFGFRGSQNGYFQQ